MWKKNKPESQTYDIPPNLAEAATPKGVSKKIIIVIVAATILIAAGVTGVIFVSKKNDNPPPVATTLPSVLSRLQKQDYAGLYEVYNPALRSVMEKADFVSTYKSVYSQYNFDSCKRLSSESKNNVTTSEYTCPSDQGRAAKLTINIVGKEESSAFYFNSIKVEQ